MKTKFHHIVRGIIIKDNKLLLANYKGHHSFLPGGHVELGESAECALIRELKEEIGIDCEVKRFLGVIENEWQDSETLHYEINHVFEVYSKDLHSDIEPISKESHLTFSWIIPNNENLIAYKIMPEPSVRRLIEKLQKEELSSCWLKNL
ncbi:NUDIX domain-containing protein [Bacillus pseudomycoides]|uniref:DNA mismatch repair protein MutT n=1 Tax=Bacillus pseudomycoides TaxID=64104 RepID=A0A2C3V302_9BACI|nr:NUDIX domain-containing protein [Bacillus pseudomycoides]PED08263.1 DNA mismatch repair protein MutT [Bacillus pseudomycoides]PEI91467.1 DNA mismatch repair protein MutT [Bacillus pseudomycoides]PEK20916.1 DNA mismatch repair protein MutT [Bacillus pseudomycoides]PEM70137.1 DNA mismatch repair protein MutT [Bacillus pseudomycoides]PEM76103.1 DNA mismatch repair protein MutT [Bacillus pseudomycoides]